MTLRAFFRDNPKAAIAFSGGVDSAYLLYAAKSCGAQITAYYAKSAFQPQFEWEDAERLSRLLHVRMKTLAVDVLADEAIATNPADRCYHCKRKMLLASAMAAAEDGFSVLLDGTNASDRESARPGMRALRELDVQSPLRACGLTKSDIRKLSEDAGLFTWKKPAYACLATRIPVGERITKEALEATELSENCLRALGFSDFRVRKTGAAATVQLPADHMLRALEQRETIVRELRNYYAAVLLDLEARKVEESD